MVIQIKPSGPQVFKALGDETRLRLLAILSRSDFNVNELIDVLGMGQSRISRHLKILADGGLVTSRREGNWSYYSLAEVTPESDLGQLTQLGLKTASGLRNHETDLQRLESVVQRRRELSQRYFDQVGPDWERLQREVLDSSYYREHVLKLLPAGKETVADLGAGAGLLLPELLSRFTSVMAIDSARTMLNVAARHLEKSAPEGLTRCDFRLGEIEHLPIPDRAVDAAVACMVLHHVSNPSGAIAEVFRILKRGGVFVLADLARHGVVEMREKYADLWLGFKRSDFNKWLNAAGFSVQASEVLVKNETMKVLIYQATKS